MRFNVLFYSECDTINRLFEENINLLLQDATVFLAKNPADTIELCEVLMFNIIVLDFGDKSFKNHKLLNDIKKIQPFTKILIHTRKKEIPITEVTLKKEFVNFFTKKKHNDELEDAVVASLNHENYYNIKPLGLRKVAKV